MSSDDTDYVAQTIINVIRYQIDKRAPQKRIQVSNKQSKNPSEATKTMIKERDMAWNEYRLNMNPENLRGYKHLKSRVKKALRDDQTTLDTNKMKKLQTKKKQWKEAKILVGWTSYGGPRMICKNGKVITSPRTMANELNMDYIVRAATAARNTPTPVQDPMNSYREMIEDRNLNMAFQTVGRLEIAQAIDKINPSKSSATDEISMRLLRKIKAPLLPVLQHLVNLTIISSKYPQPLKHTTIVPLLKKGKEQMDTKSYRGVNLIPSLAKVIDKILLIQLLKHLEMNQLIPHQHHEGYAITGQPPP